MEKLVLKNFRRFRSLELELNKINVIVGKNNVGKTTILEAFALAASAPYLTDSLGSSIFRSILLNREIPYYLEFVKLGAKKAEVTLGDKKVEIVKELENEILRKKISDEKEKEKGLQVLDALKYMISALVEEMPEVEHPEYSSTYALAKHGEQMVSHYVEVDMGSINIFRHINDSSSELKPSPVYFVTDHMFYSTKALAYIINNSIKNDYKYFTKVLTSFKKYMKEFDIEDVRVVENQVYLIIKGKPIPISQIGSGAKRALLKELISGNAEYIAMDTPENDLHPGLLRSFLDQIVDLRAKLLISTHSLDTIEALVDVLEIKRAIDDMTVFRLDMNGVETIPGREVMIRLKDIGEDLRGL
ncbi:MULTISPECIES: AAA family ATPase [Metallosphaera]|uniref:Uncharacterized protein n=3 Tax=Metallosphaera TaxID=41980 RepID=A4YFU2_METS5|nr:MULTISPECIES: AAA family ATPase [Metallosphaera]ABP95294.1 hypothetical protein Msed_1132 [Metallosphaera sedula DSM 5348]AIM27280.1 hypothetical protein HA72_1132 [Metallosphaera sedula]AKV74168.1 hypothetical protein MsedA_1148 [Metallosphaera sedula]AKV76407.1 hypothetical protein MsedB_1150 [Metallosphaera sedula]AKV78659.1 hypothetical protein MsedC_1148 [Metallosphaera sedula]